ncbi:MAG TPA: hypothetical protein PLJ35_22230 [Anaerolineae bacterium]|nr:hypothetical protein [Anaerolineae bacterium]
MKRLQHPCLDEILGQPHPADGPVPPEAYKDPDELAFEQLLASIDGFGDLPEPPEMPALALAA